MPQINRNTRLAEINAVVWFLGYGVGCATGLASVYAVVTIGSKERLWLAIAATLIAVIHATILIVFWLNREVVRLRSALLVSMIASAMLTFSLARIIAAHGLQTTPLYGLAFMHLLMAFCNQANFNIRKTTE